MLYTPVIQNKVIEIPEYFMGQILLILLIQGQKPQAYVPEDIYLICR